MKRRAVLGAVAVAAVPTAGCLGATGDPDESDDECESADDELERDELAEVVHLREHGDDEDPRLEGVVVNFGDDTINVDVIAEFYRNANGVDEILGTRRVSILDVFPRNGDPFTIPYPDDDGPDELEFDLTVEVTAVFD